MKIIGTAHGVIIKGGPGSGFAGHAGIPGHQGGSQAEFGSGWKPFSSNEYTKDIPGGRLKIQVLDGGKTIYARFEPTDSGAVKFPKKITNGAVGVDEYEKFISGKLGIQKPEPKVEETKPTDGLETVDSYDKIQSKEIGGTDSKGYFIMPDGKLVDINSEFGPGTNDHVGFLTAGEHPEAFGMSKNEAKKFLAAYENDDAGTIGEGWNKVFQSGIIRVREFGDEIAIETNTMDNSTLHRLQKLYDGSKLGLPYKARISWLGWDTQTEMFDVTMEDFLSARYVVNGVLKEKEESIITLPRITATLKQQV